MVDPRLVGRVLDRIVLRLAQVVRGGPVRNGANELAAPVRTAFEAHLGVCPDCRRYLDSYRKTIAISKSAFTAPLDPTQVPDQLIKAILAAKRTSAPI